MSGSESGQSFIDAVLAGDAMPSDIDDYIDVWHGSTEEVPLWTFLGLTEHEYALWVEQPDVLNFLIRSKKYQVPVEKILDMNEAHLLAARSTSNGSSGALIEWLYQTGRIA